MTVKIEISPSAELLAEAERETVHRYVQSYLEQPESGLEIAVAQAVGASTLAQEPWA